MAVTKTVNLTERLAERREAVKKELRKEGLELPPRPGFALPRLPLALTDLDDHRLMRLLAAFTRYQDHLSGQLVEAEIDERAAENVLEVTKARHLVRGWTGASGDRVTVQKAEALLDEAVQERSAAYEVIHARRKLLSILVESLARDAAVVSRELTRRVGRSDHERRLDRWSP